MSIVNTKMPILGAIVRPIGNMFGSYTNSKKNRQNQTGLMMQAALGMADRIAANPNGNPFEGVQREAWAGYSPGSYVTPDGGVFINNGNPMISASDKLGAVTRAQYSEWIKNFQPAEGDLLSMTTYDGNEGVANKLIAEGTTRIDANFRGAEGQQNRNLARYGMAMDDSEREAFNRESDVNKGAALVDMTNKANRWQEDLNKTIMSTGVSTSGLKKA